jgi:tetratricopeptide (TPR) repeat protein
LIRNRTIQVAGLTILPEPMLVGRDHELDVLNAALIAAISGKGSVVFVSGEAGSGKTRLISEFLEEAGKRDIIVLRGWCLCNAAVPYFPFVEALESFLAGSEEDSVRLRQLGLKTLLTVTGQPDAYGDQSGFSPQVLKEQRFSAITKELVLLSTDKPLVLFLDDLHWADSASLSLLNYVSRGVGSERILIIATFRSEEVGQSVEGVPNPLVDTLRLMGRQDLVNELKLSNLGLADVGKIVRYMLGGAVGSGVAEKFLLESRGNPLFVIESVRMLHESGKFVVWDGVWNLSAESLGVPSKVKDIILRRLDALKPAQRKVLDVASVIGDRFDPHLLGAVLNQDSLEVLETLNSVALSRSLVCVEGDFYRFDHAKSREVLYDEILLPLRKGYHERVAERMEVLAPDVENVLLADLSHHFAKAGNVSKAVKYSLLAGNDTLARFSNAEAIKHYSYVLEKSEGLAEFFEERIEALEGLGSALVESGSQSRAIGVYEQLFETAKSELVRLRALRKAMFVATYQGDLVAVQRLAERAEGIPAVDRLEHARVHLYLATAHLFGERKSKAVEDIETALRVFEEERSLADFGDALVEAGIIFGKSGRVQDSVFAGLLSFAVLKDADDLKKVVAYGHLTYDYLASGLSKEAVDTASEGIRLGEKIDNPRTAWLYFFSAAAKDFLAARCAAFGQTAEAGRYCASAMADYLKGAEIAQKTDGYYILCGICCGLSKEFLTSGNLSKAEEYYGLYRKVRNNFGPNMEMALVPEGLSAEGAIHVAKGEWAEANRCYEEVLSNNQERMGFSVLEVAQHLSYGKALFAQNRLQEAHGQMTRGQVMVRELAAKFENVSLRAQLWLPLRVESEKLFDVDVYLVNVSKKPAKVVRVEGLVMPGFEVSSLPSGCSLRGDSVEVAGVVVDPFSVRLLKFGLRAVGAGVLRLEPVVVYEDELGKTETFRLNGMNMIVNALPEAGVFGFGKLAGESEVKFSSVFSRRAFDYLVSAFEEDCSRKKMPTERAGWRTLMDLVREGKVSKYSVYGASGSRGLAVAELERKGLVEARVFSGERGRGGEIIRVRVAYDGLAAQKYLHDLSK